MKLFQGLFLVVQGNNNADIGPLLLLLLALLLLSLLLLLALGRAMTLLRSGWRACIRGRRVHRIG